MKKFYLHDAATAVSGTLPGTGASQSTTSPSVTATGAGTNRSMDQNIGVSQVAEVSLTSLANTSAQTFWFRRFVSPVLAAQTIQAGAWQYRCGLQENNASANFQLAVGCLYIWRPSTGAVVAKLYDSTTIGGVEPGTTESDSTVFTLVASAGPVTIQDGDVLIYEMWGGTAGQGNSTARTNGVYYDGTTEGSTSSNAAYILSPVEITLFTAVAPTIRPTPLLMTLAAQLKLKHLRNNALLHSDPLKVTIFGDVITDNMITTIDRALQQQGDGLLNDSSFGLWYASANMVANGGFESGTASPWTQLFGGSNSIINTDSRFGTLCLKVNPVVAGDGIVDSQRNVTNATKYSVSAWVKGTSGDGINIYDSNTGAMFDTTFTLSGSGWQRFSLTFTASATAQITVTITNSSNTHFFLVDGIQLEQLAYASPYIDTVGVSGVSRRQGYIGLPKYVVSAAQGWVAVRYRPEVVITGEAHTLVSVEQDNSNYFTLVGTSTGYSCNFLSGGHNGSVFNVGSAVAGTPVTVILYWTGNNLLISYNGGNFVTATPTSEAILSAINNLFIGFDSPDTGFDVSPAGEILWVAAGQGTLSNADASTINGFGDAGSAINYPSASGADLYWPADTDDWLVPTLATGNVYTESATITSVTSLSATETTQDVDSNTVGGTTTPSASETTQFVDGDTPSSVTSITAFDTQQIDRYVPQPLLMGLGRVAPMHMLFHMNQLNPADSVRVQYPDSATITSITDPSGAGTSVETAQYTDANTVGGITTPSATDVAAFVDASTVPGVTDPSQSVEAAQYAESATPATVTDPSQSVENAQYVDANTVASVTQILYQEQIIPQAAIPRPLMIVLDRIGLRLLNNNTVDLASPPPLQVYTDAATITSITDPSQSVETAQYVDANTVGSVSTPSATETAQYVDGDTPSTVGQVSSTEIAQDVESATPNSVTSVIYTENAQYVDQFTVPGVTDPSQSVDTAQFVDAATVAGVTSVTSQDQQIGWPNIPQPILIKLSGWFGNFLRLKMNILNPADSVRVEYDDSATISSVTSISELEEHDIPDSGTCSATTSITSADTAQYVDSDTPATTGSCTLVDTAGTLDSNTVNSITDPSASIDTAQYVDGDTPSSVSSTTYTEVAVYVDSDTPTSTTQPSSTDIAAYVDSATVAGVTTISAFEIATPTAGLVHVLLIKLARFHKTHLLFNTQLDSPPHTATEYDDANTIATVTDVSQSTEVTAYVDSQTIGGVSTPSAIEDAQYVESNTISTVGSVSSTETTQYTDSGTPTTDGSVTFTDIAAYVDASPVNGTSTLSAIEAANYVDANSPTSTTTLSAIDIYAHTYQDSNTTTSTTSTSYVETAQYVESNTCAGVTSVIYTEQYIQNPTRLDSATITSITTVIPFDIKVECDLYVVTTHRRWTTQFGARWASSNTRRWTVITNGPRYDAEGMKQWTAS